MNDVLRLMLERLPDGARASSFRCPASRKTTFCARAGRDEVRFDLPDAEVEEWLTVQEGARLLQSAWDPPDLPPRLAAFVVGLTDRLRASWARPAQPWPDCLPPMFGSCTCGTHLPWLRYDKARGVYTDGWFDLLEDFGPP